MYNQYIAFKLLRSGAGFNHFFQLVYNLADSTKECPL